MYYALRRLWRNPQLWQLALAGAWTVLFVATHLPPGSPGLPASGVDKLTHFAAFGVLSAIFAMTWEVSAGRLMWRHLVWAWLILALYGAFDEWTQEFVGRDGNFADWAADATGVAIGLAAFLLVRGRFEASVSRAERGRV